MEKYRGKEALTNYSFRDVTLKPAEAMNILTSKTTSSFDDSAKKLIDDLSFYPAMNRDAINILKELRNNPGKYLEGGLTITTNDLGTLRKKWGNLTFKNVIEKAATEVFPTFFNKNARNPGTMCVGFILDMLRIIDPKVASFEEGVSVVVEGIRESKYPFELLGAMVDDAIHLRGTEAIPFELFADREGTKQFRDLVLHFANDGEKKSFELGLKLTKEEMEEALRIISLN